MDNIIEKNDGWEEQDIRKLMEYRNNGYTFARIAQELNKSPDDCVKKMKKVKAKIDPKDFIIKGKLWTVGDEQLLYGMKRNGDSYGVIASVLSRTVEDCREKYLNTNWQSRPFYTKSDQLKKIELEKIKEDARQKILNARDVKAESNKIQGEILADAISSSLKSLPEVAPNIYVPNLKRIKKHESEDVGLMLSDFHIGHNHTLKETGGISEYNINIFFKRVEKLKYALKDIVELHRNLYEIPKLHIFCLGDIVAGMNDVGKWSSTFIDTDIMDQWTKGVNSIADMIYYWLPMFEEIKFYGVRGNHGRVANLGVEKDYANWDILTYKMLEQRFASNPRIKFEVPDTWWIKTEIRNHKFLIIHGDDIKGSGSPIKSIQSYANKWAPISDFMPNYVLAGHFHNCAELSIPKGRVLINGSFVGGDVHSLKNVCESTKPEQKIFGIHNKRGLTWGYNIDLSFNDAEEKKG